MNVEAIKKQSEFYDSFYIYDESVIDEYTERLKKCFKGVEFLYSVKTNPNIQVVKTVVSHGFGADAASLNEVLLCEKCGLPKDKIYYSAPGKSDYDIKGAINKSVITADSLNEISKINKIAGEMGIKAEIGVRINPNFSFYGNGGGSPSKFGIDEDSFFESFEKIKSFNNIKITGIHVHLHSQELDTEILTKYYNNMMSLSKKAEDILGNLKFINLGSGIGIPYSKTQKEADVETLGEIVSQMAAKLKEKNNELRIFVETGRYAVGKNGTYITKVLDKKTSFGKTFVILCNTLNGFVRPAMAHIIEKYAKDENPAESEPFYTCKNAFDYIVLNNADEEETVTLCGNLCTSTDIIEEDISLPKMELGDLLAITNAGSYATVITPEQFASLRGPVQLLLKNNGQVIRADI